jgi:hypothetical protein
VSRPLSPGRLARCRSDRGPRPPGLPRAACPGLSPDRGRGELRWAARRRSRSGSTSSPGFCERLPRPERTASPSRRRARRGADHRLSEAGLAGSGAQRSSARADPGWTGRLARAVPRHCPGPPRALTVVRRVTDARAPSDPPGSAEPDAPPGRSRYAARPGHDQPGRRPLPRRARLGRSPRGARLPARPLRDLTPAPPKPREAGAALAVCIILTILSVDHPVAIVSRCSELADTCSNTGIDRKEVFSR